MAGGKSQDKDSGDGGAAAAAAPAAPKHGGVDPKYYEHRDVVEAFTPLRLALEEDADLFGSDKVVVAAALSTHKHTHTHIHTHTRTHTYIHTHTTHAYGGWPPCRSRRIASWRS
jgi:hypothetical protein